MANGTDVDIAVAVAWAAGSVGPIMAARELVGGWTSTMLALRVSDGAEGEVVLRLMTREPWRTRGEALTTRESQIQQLLAATTIPVPRSLALDSQGRWCGYPAHLMSLLPGRIDPDRVDPGSLGRLADLLATIHTVEPSIEVRAYQPWAWEAKYVVPGWASDPALWEDAFALLRGDPPPYDPCFIHRDFGPRNVLWSGEEITGGDATSPSSIPASVPRQRPARWRKPSPWGVARSSPSAVPAHW